MKLISLSSSWMFCSKYVFRGQTHMWGFSCPATKCDVGVQCSHVSHGWSRAFNQGFPNLISICLTNDWRNINWSLTTNEIMPNLRTKKHWISYCITHYKNIEKKFATMKLNVKYFRTFKPICVDFIDAILFQIIFWGGVFE